MATSSPLVGRAEERERLVGALIRCASGAGGLVLVSGEAGIGKSRLLADVLAGWEGALLSTTAMAGSRAYAPLLTALAPRAAVTAGIPNGRSEDGRPEGIVAALRTRAHTAPTVLVLEDLHLADAATVQLVPVITETLASEPFLVLATYRSDALPRAHPIRAMRAALRRAGHLDDIALRPLTERGTAELLAALLAGRVPSPALVSSVQRRTEGVPFFVEEIAAALVEGGGLVHGPGGVGLVDGALLPLPEGVRDAVLTRTADLCERHGAAVEHATTLGVQVDLAALAALTSPAEVDALVDAGLLVEVDGELGSFRHALVRDALYRSIPWGRRRGLHARVADVLAGRGAAPGVVAEHWIAAHEPTRARPLRDGGRGAVLRGARVPRRRRPHPACADPVAGGRGPRRPARRVGETRRLRRDER